MTNKTLKYPFPADVASILRAIGCRKRTAFVYRDVPTEPRVLHSYWDGGSRDSYVVLRNGGKVYPPTYGGQFVNGGHAPEYMPESGDILVRYGTFAGKEAIPSITFFVR